MSEIKVDTLTGKTSAGNITVTSEGGAATMQLQQGLLKHWAHTNNTGTTVVDSFNLSSLGDTATGTQTFNFSNAMSNADFCAQATCHEQTAIDVFLRRVAYGTTTSSVTSGAYDGSSYTDVAIGMSVKGDLA